MRRGLLLVAVASLAALFVTPRAAAETREVSMGNYWFEDDATGSRNRIVVERADQIRFTVREAAYPPHSVVIDEYGIDSGPLLLFQTYTTPRLNRPGTFAVYCRDHRRRGHETTLIVKAPASSSPSARASAPSSASKKRASPAAPAATEEPSVSEPPQGGASPEPGEPQPRAGETLAPVGVGTAADRRRPSPDPDSLAGLLGRRIGGDVPWTSAVWLSVVAAVPVALLAGYALRREMRRHALVGSGSTHPNLPIAAREPPAQSSAAPAGTRAAPARRRSGSSRAERPGRPRRR